MQWCPGGRAPRKPGGKSRWTGWTASTAGRSGRTRSGSASGPTAAIGCWALAATAGCASSRLTSLSKILTGCAILRQAPEIRICKRPNGSDWLLGFGGYGGVCIFQAHQPIQNPYWLCYTSSGSGDPDLQAAQRQRLAAGLWRLRRGVHLPGSPAYPKSLLVVLYFVRLRRSGSASGPTAAIGCWALAATAGCASQAQFLCCD